MVIAILAGMLLPALNQAKQQAHSIKCVSNLKQWGNAWVMYQNDYNDYVNACDSSTAYNMGGGNKNTSIWYGFPENPATAGRIIKVSIFCLPTVPSSIASTHSWQATVWAAPR